MFCSKTKRFFEYCFYNSSNDYVNITQRQYNKILYFIPRNLSLSFIRISVFTCSTITNYFIVTISTHILCNRL